MSIPGKAKYLVIIYSFLSIVFFVGLGDKKARALIDSGRFQSLVDLSEASLIDLKSVLDANSARSVHGFFNMEN